MIETTKITLAKVKEVVCEVYGLAWESIIAESSSYKETEARHCFMYVCAKKMGLKLTLVSQLVNRKGHSNTCQHVNSIQFIMDNLQFLKESKPGHRRLIERNKRVLIVLDKLEKLDVNA